MVSYPMAPARNGSSMWFILWPLLFSSVMPAVQSAPYDCQHKSVYFAGRSFMARFAQHKAMWCCYNQNLFCEGVPSTTIGSVSTSPSTTIGSVSTSPSTTIGSVSTSTSTPFLAIPAAVLQLNLTAEEISAAQEIMSDLYVPPTESVTPVPEVVFDTVAPSVPTSTAAALPTATQLPTATKVTTSAVPPTTTQLPTTTKVATLAVLPAAAQLSTNTEVPTSAVLPTAAQRSTTTKVATSAELPAAAQRSTTTKVATSAELPTAAQRSTTTKVATSAELPTAAQRSTTTKVSSAAVVVEEAEVQELRRNKPGIDHSIRAPMLSLAEWSSCLKQAVVYEPLNMDNTHPIYYVKSITECQNICRNTTDCGFFNFFVGLKTCHLSLPTAMETTGREGFIAGPPSCAETGQGASANTVREEFMKDECMSFKTSYSDLPLHNQTLTYAPDPLRCQSECASKTWCMHFTYNTLTQSCNLHDSNAIAVPAIMFQVSGPWACEPRITFDMHMSLPYKVLVSQNLTEALSNLAKSALISYVGTWEPYDGLTKLAPRPLLQDHQIQLRFQACSTHGSMIEDETEIFVRLNLSKANTMYVKDLLNLTEASAGLQEYGNQWLDAHFQEEAHAKVSLGAIQHLRAYASVKQSASIHDVLTQSMQGKVEIHQQIKSTRLRGGAHWGSNSLGMLAFMSFMGFGAWAVLGARCKPRAYRPLETVREAGVGSSANAGEMFVDESAEGLVYLAAVAEDDALSVPGLQ
ncbi:unnamed protein product [Polarella glacialis]|uniref:Apple domain-containing protein n=1 Tax=Polarella glacialis TaxID=89957 RepID=A0A813GM01_POLGL|nr:unnamed protein product [Polarella glacialis]